MLLLLTRQPSIQTFSLLGIPYESFIQAVGMRRWPRRARPRNRVIFVVVPVSSRKMSLCGSCRMCGWRFCRHSSRASRTSSRSHSDASSVFFKGVPRRQQGPRQRRGMGVHALRFLQLKRQLRHRDVRLSVDPRRQQAGVRRQLAAAARPALARRQSRARLASPLFQFHRKTRADAEMPRRRATGRPATNVLMNTIPKIERIRLSHDPPPRHSESEIEDLGNPPRFRFIARCSRRRLRIWPRLLRRCRGG